MRIILCASRLAYREETREPPVSRETIQALKVRFGEKYNRDPFRDNGEGGVTSRSHFSSVQRTIAEASSRSLTSSSAREDFERILRTLHLQASQRGLSIPSLTSAQRVFLADNQAARTQWMSRLRQSWREQLRQRGSNVGDNETGAEGDEDGEDDDDDDAGENNDEEEEDDDDD